MIAKAWRGREPADTLKLLIRDTLSIVPTGDAGRYKFASRVSVCLAHPNAEPPSAHFACYLTDEATRPDYEHSFFGFFVALVEALNGDYRILHASTSSANLPQQALLAGAGFMFVNRRTRQSRGSLKEFEYLRIKKNV